MSYDSCNNILLYLASLKTFFEFLLFNIDDGISKGAGKGSTFSDAKA